MKHCTPASSCCNYYCKKYGWTDEMDRALCRMDVQEHLSNMRHPLQTIDTTIKHINLAK